MADNEQDPARDTQQFRRFAQQQEGSEPDPTERTGFPAGLLVGVLAVVGLIVIAAIIALIAS
ncbi:hypothetical protein [Actinocorallia aurantiaca]|uniref:Flagellin-like protein n=1 Tax=Actinocorallia aurantiaca TaxID=46204 RepID=A0ABN3TUE3_9ACTN